MPQVPALGRTLGQRFILEEQIGAGGMGTVYRAHDLQTERTVAIKVLQPHGTPQEAERFAREAQLLAGLRHPHIVSYIADGHDEAGQYTLVLTKQAVLFEREAAERSRRKTLLTWLKGQHDALAGAPKPTRSSGRKAASSSARNA